MGSGKTSAAIEMMNNDTENNYIFITPYLSEVERVKKSCTNRKFHEPKFQSIHGELHTKFDSLHSLLLNQKNIASTHALFKRASEETRELIRDGNYILILDEVMDVIEQLTIKRDDLDILFETDLIYIDNGFVRWNEDKRDYNTRYNDIRDMAINNNLIYYRDTILIWSFPSDIFKSFKDVYILTYMFDGQIQKYYYDMNNVEYKKYIAVKEDNAYTFKNRDNYPDEDEEFKKFLQTKITIYDGNLNNIGENPFALSKSWFQKRKESVSILKKNIANFFKNKVKAKSDQIMWTTFKDYQSKLQGLGYTKAFLSLTARATNDYKDKKYLVYAANRFVNPILDGFFTDKGISIDQDRYAVADFVQWVWRSAIREQKEITIYIPSKRMRELFIHWLNNDL